ARPLRAARTIADLAGSARLQPEPLAGAIGSRSLGRKLGRRCRAPAAGGPTMPKTAAVLFGALAVGVSVVPARAEGPPLDGDGRPLPPHAVARLGRLRFRTGACVAALAFAPDGKTLVSGHQDGALTLWDAATGLPKWRRPRPEGAGGVTGLAFTLRGEAVASASQRDKGTRL